MISNKMAAAIMLLTLACTLGSCSSDVQEPQLPGEPVAMNTIPVAVTLSTNQPRTEAASTRDMLRAATFGDPGLYEEFVAPTNLYILVWFQRTAASEPCIEVIKQTATWTKQDDETDLQGQAAGNGDIYLAEGPHVSVPRSIYKGRVLVFGATEDVFGSWPQPDGQNLFSTNTEEERTESEINALKAAGRYDWATTEEGFLAKARSLVYDVPAGKFTGTPRYSVFGDVNQAGAASQFLAGVYCTPIDLTTDGDITGRNNTGNIVLYHNAARLDLKWEVREAQRNDASLAVRSIKVNNLESRGISAFAPASIAPTGGATYFEQLTTDPGSQYAFRQYIYVAQLGASSGFPLSYTVTNTAGASVSSSATLPSGSDIYTSWLRYNLTIGKN